MEEAPTMHRDAGIGLLRRTRSTPGRACQVAVSPAAHGLSTLLVPTPASGWSEKVLVKRPQHTLLVATFVELENPDRTRSVGRSAPGHRQVVRHLPEQASRRRGEKERDG